MAKFDLNFKREKETKNAVRYEEVPAEGNPNVIGSLYVQKWAVGTADRIVVTVSVGEDAAAPKSPKK